jgi:AcrR family transcriptional regulator
MGRLKGSRNHDYDARRHALALSVASALVDDTGSPRSVKELASRVSVTVPTLLHYFGDREGMVKAALESVGAEGASRASLIDALATRPLAAALEGFATNLIDAFRGFGLGRIFSSALTLSLGHPALGPEFLKHLLEPTLLHAEQLAVALEARGEMKVPDVRAFAVTFVSPLVLALLHQDSLGGRQHRALNLDAFVRSHLEMVMRGVTPGGRRRARR